MANASLNFEDFYTLLTQTEAILNSRLLAPLSSDPNDFSPLTPLASAPEKNYISRLENYLPI